MCFRVLYRQFCILYPLCMSCPTIVLQIKVRTYVITEASHRDNYTTVSPNICREQHRRCTCARRRAFFVSKFALSDDTKKKEKKSQRKRSVRV